MCILIVKPAGVGLPPQHLLERYAQRNPHGFGYATGAKTYKTMSYKAFLREIAKEDASEAMLIHFRYATHGSKKKNNCHPFKDEATGVVFAHNGILPVQPIGDMTDSETAFRWLFQPHIAQGGIYSRALAKEVKSIIGGSKVAFINALGQIKTFGEFTEVDGIYYSNMRY